MKKIIFSIIAVPIRYHFSLIILSLSSPKTQQQPISVDKFLSTKPLRSEVSTRKGPGGMKLSYMGGDVVTKTLNECFGYDGWSLEVKDKTQLDPIKDDKGRYHVAFTATVRITHRRTGAFREDCGAGDAIDKSLASASGNALKGAVTDAMKRAARHFGEKLGNSLYHDDFNVNKAPANLKDACDMLDIERANGRFGFDKDRKIPTQTQASSNAAAAASTNASQTNNNVAKTGGGGGVQNAHNYTKPTPPLYVGGCVAQQQTPRTTMTSKVSNQPKTQPKVANTSNNASSKASYVTPHHHGMNPNNSNRSTSSSGIPPPQHRPTTAKTAAALSAKENENANISQTTAKLHQHQQQQVPPPKTGGLNLPKRPGTSRGVVNNNPGADDAMKAFYGNDMAAAATNTTNSAAPSMFASSGGMSQALMMEQQQQQQQSLSSSLKRKSDGLDHNPNAIKKMNPYSQA